MSKICSQCGAPIEGNAKFCSYCGSKIDMRHDEEQKESVNRIESENLTNDDFDKIFNEDFEAIFNQDFFKKNGSNINVNKNIVTNTRTIINGKVIEDNSKISSKDDDVNIGELMSSIASLFKK